MAANSPRVASTAFFMRSSMSLYSWGNTAAGPPHERADRLAPDDAFDVPLAHQLEHDDREPVVHAQRQRGVVEHFQTELQHLEIIERIEAHRSRILLRIGVVDAVHLRRLEDRFGADLKGAQRGGRIGREIRISRAGCEDDHPALLQMADRAAPDVRLGYLRHGDRRLHSGGHADVFERVLQSECVDDGREHAHVVRGRAVHARVRRGFSAPDVAAADDASDLHPRLRDLFDLIGYGVNGVGVDRSRTWRREGFAAELEEDSAIDGLRAGAVGAHLFFTDVEARKAPHLDVLTQHADGGVDEILDRLGLVAHVGLLQQHRFLPELVELAVVGGLVGVADVLGDVFFIDVQRTGGADVNRQIVRQPLELLVLGDEIGLAAQLDERAELAALVDVMADEALVHRTLGLLRGYLLASLGQQFLGFFDVAGALAERTPAVHDARVGRFAQRFDIAGAGGIFFHHFVWFVFLAIYVVPALEICRGRL